MPSNKKILTNAKERVSASARVKICVKKTRKVFSTESSYLDKVRDKGTVSTLNTVDQPKNSAQSNNDTKYYDHATRTK